MTSSVQPDLVRAYRETNFIVFSEAGDFCLNVGRVCSDLARTMEQFEATTAAVLTACNPASQPTPCNRVAARTAALTNNSVRNTTPILQQSGITLSTTAAPDTPAATRGENIDGSIGSQSRNT